MKDEQPDQPVRIDIFGWTHTMWLTTDLEGSLDYPYVITLWRTYSDSHECRAVLIPNEYVEFQVPRYQSGLYLTVRPTLPAAERVALQREIKETIMRRLQKFPTE